MTAQILFRGELFADYFQIYLRDEAHPVLPDDYTDENIASHLMVSPHAIILHTARNMTVPIEVEWHRERPAPDLPIFHHIVEAAFACPTGCLVLAGLTDDDGAAPRLTVPTGLIGVRTCLAGLDSLDEYGLEGSDTYLLQLWPEAESRDRHVLKAWLRP